MHTVEFVQPVLIQHACMHEAALLLTASLALRQGSMQQAYASAQATRLTKPSSLMSIRLYSLREMLGTCARESVQHLHECKL